MNKVLYKKKDPLFKKRVLTSLGVFMVVIGFSGMLYVIFPLLSWQFYFSAFASESVISPIPDSSNENTLDSLFNSSTSQLFGVDYSNASNWFPDTKPEYTKSKVPSYTLSIPKINITNAVVSTADADLKRHMVQYNSEATPPEKGNAVVFGHSSLPQLFNPNDYTTILANAYTLQRGDSVIVTVENVSYMYKIESIRIVSANDTSVFARKYNDSYLTLVTCTPPGTIWKRLVLQARLQAM